MESEDHEKLGDELERLGDELGKQSDELGEEIDQARSDWRAKRQDGGIPGAPPLEDEDQAGEGADDTPREDDSEED